MNHANIKTSERLQRVDKFLSDGLFHSTLEIIEGTRLCAINSIVSELRRNGRHIVGRWEGRIYYYRMVKEKEREA